MLDLCSLGFMPDGSLWELICLPSLTLKTIFNNSELQTKYIILGVVLENPFKYAMIHVCVSS